VPHGRGCGGRQTEEWVEREREAGGKRAGWRGQTKEGGE